ncbi:MAG: GNAT family N-acetyltransferase [Rhodospirillaceae bacterium]|nr:GNAT family N-acetyltransferase [Rhodospirillaceae bacterium]MBT5459107.1 GNAT family N-acetyltransferase [Rhodospirillaceae bacterium]
MVHPVPTNALAFDIAESPSAFLALEKDWRDLFTRAVSPSYCQSFDWLRAAWDNVASGNGCKLHIVVGRREGRVVLIWPLIIDDWQVRLLASDKLEYRGLLVEECTAADCWVQEAWAFVKNIKNVDIFLFQDVPSTSPLARLLGAEEQRCWKSETGSAAIRLGGFSSWNDYAVTLPKKLLSDQRRQWRRIAANGAPVQFNILDSTDEIEKNIDWIFHHKMAWLAEKGLKPVSFGSAEHRAFVRDTVMTARSSDGALLMGNLSVGDVTVAAGFGFLYRGAFTFYMFTYDLAWQTYSPARLWLEEFITWCIDNHVASFDFMPGDTGYKGIWANDEMGVTDFMIPASIRGSTIANWHGLAVAKWVDRAWIKAAFHILPIRWQRWARRLFRAYPNYAGRIVRS